MYETKFQERINRLYGESGLSSIEKFANLCGVSRQSMQYYMAGQRKPDSEGLLKLCKACSVSSDWLIGITDTRSLSADTQSVVQYTGLSEEAVEKIHSLPEELTNALSDITTSLSFTMILHQYYELLELIEDSQSDEHISQKEWSNIFSDAALSDMHGIKYENGKVSITPGKAISLLCNEIGTSFTSMCLLKLNHYYGLTNEDSS